MDVEQTAAAIEAASLFADEVDRVGGETLIRGLWVELTRRILDRSANTMAEANNLIRLGQAVQEASAAAKLH
jgi:hypothetical protein